MKNSFPSRLSHVWLSGQLFQLAEGWLSSGITAPALALDGADLGLCEDSANFWQNDFLMTFPYEGTVRITPYLLVNCGGPGWT